MDEEQCDLDGLVAFLDEPDGEFDENLGDICAHNQPEGDIDAFLAESDSDDDKSSDVAPKTDTDGQLTKTKSEYDNSDAVKDDSSESDRTPNKDIHDEIEQMRRKLLELERKAAASESTDSNTAETPSMVKKTIGVWEVSEDLFFAPPAPETKTKSLVHSDNESDQEDDYVEKAELNTCGKEIQAILNKENKARVAHISKHETNSRSFQQKDPVKKAPSPNNKFYGTNSSYVAPHERAATNKKPDVDDGSYVDPFSKIRMVNPLVSSQGMKTRMEGKKMIKLSCLHRKVGTTDVTDSDWVTMGVVVSKSETRKSANVRRMMGGNNLK